MIMIQILLTTFQHKEYENMNHLQKEKKNDDRNYILNNEILLLYTN